MNNEKKLYELIKKNGGELIMQDVDVATIIGVSKFSIPKYKKKLIDAGYIQTVVKVIENKPQTIYKIIKEYSKHEGYPYLVEKINVDDILNKAIVYATEKHNGANRKGTKLPYIVHPLESLSIAATITEDKEILAACVLHDVLENTDTMFEELRNEFGTRVAVLVASDSENKREGQNPEDTWKIRKEETLKYLDKSTYEQQIVTIADKLSNLRAIYRDYNIIGEKLWDRFRCKDISEQKWYYQGIAERLLLIKNTFVYKEYIELINKVFN